jgi:hypothetical protein
MLQIPVFGNCHPSVTLKTPLIDLEMSMCIVDATKRYIYFIKTHNKTIQKTKNMINTNLTIKTWVNSDAREG